jgi:hypothetical protein
MPNYPLHCWECTDEISSPRETELGLCSRCEREAMDRKDHQAALLGADLAKRDLDQGKYAQRALDRALTIWLGGGK